ncbi:MAG TPA: hypothetical protein PKD99_16925 [Sphingopyxis sp.]|nr:hypothetical protein [Sphingopyxis sp.]HMP46785.1 hypothetical protein [Sphingopyxis sp.]HMQ19244.1 hypothetical protein [Sphingopyxis sp.]
MTMSPPKAVRIMAEYESDGIWDVPLLPREALDGFRISPGLYARLQRWVARYAELERAEGLNGDRTHLGWPDFDREGYAIAFAVKAERPGWRVFYSDNGLLLDKALFRPGFRLVYPVEIPDHLN